MYGYDSVIIWLYSLNPQGTEGVVLTRIVSVHAPDPVPCRVNWIYDTIFYQNQKVIKLRTLLFSGLFCVDSSAPDGYLRSADCDKMNNYICEIAENDAFQTAEGNINNS